VTRLRTGLLPPLLTLALGCSGGAGSTETEAASSGSASTSDSDTDGASTAGEVCEPFFAGRQDVAGDTVTFTIRNTTAAPVWIQASYLGEGDNNRAQVVELRPEGVADPLLSNITECDFPCTGFTSDPCNNGCTDNGPGNSPIFLDVGGSYVVEWDGRHLVADALPAACTPTSCTDAVTCGVWTSAGAGSYAARVTFGAAISCDSCTCTPNADGWCTIEQHGADLNDPQILDTPFALPSADVELVISD
jgi:hypothetical protein